MSDRTTTQTPLGEMPAEDAEFGEEHEPAILGAASTVQLSQEDQSRRARRRAAAAEAAALAEQAKEQPFEPTGIVHVFQPGGTDLVPIRDYVRSIWERRAFLVELSKADLRGNRSNTALGRIWGVLDPLFQAAVYYFLFRVISSGSSRPLDFLPILVAGIFLLSLTMTAINEGGRSIKLMKGLLLNSAFPRAMLPLVSQYKSLLAFIPSIGVIFFCFFAFGGEAGPQLFLLPLVFALQLVMNVGLALCTATVVTMIRDASNVVSYITRLLFFATPVIYPVDRLPETAYNILQWQPLFPIFAAYQKIFSGEVPEPRLWITAAVWSVVLVVVGIRTFRRHEHEFAMHL